MGSIYPLQRSSLVDRNRHNQCLGNHVQFDYIEGESGGVRVVNQYLQAQNLLSSRYAKRFDHLKSQALNIETTGLRLLICLFPNRIVSNGIQEFMALPC